MKKRSKSSIAFWLAAACLLLVAVQQRARVTAFLLSPLHAQIESGPDENSPVPAAQIDDVFWDPRFDSNAPNARVFAIAIDGDDVYIGGQFTAAGGVAAQGIAKWDGHVWLDVGGGVDGWVQTLEVYEGNLYVGGSFAHAGGVLCNNIARWDGSSWHALGSGTTDFQITPPIQDMAVYQGELYAGGGFRKIGGTTAYGVARWDGSSWYALESGVGFDNDVGLVFGMDADSSYLYLGGRFLTAGGDPNPYLVKWDGVEYLSVGETGFLGTINSIAVVNGDLYVAGNYLIAPGDTMTVANLGMWDGTGWHDLGGGANYRVESLARLGSDIYAVGLFTAIGGISARRVAKWDGSSWSKFGSGLQFDGVAGSVWAVAPKSDEEFFAGGDFNIAGWKPSPHFARWYASPPPNLTVAPDSIGDLLYTGATAVHEVTIKNIGGMVLEWNVTVADSQGALLSPAGGRPFADATAPGVFSGGRFFAEAALPAHPTADDSLMARVPDAGTQVLDSPWANAEPLTGELYPGDSAGVQVTFNAAGLSGGEYDAILTVGSNHPDEPGIPVQLHLQMTDAPDIALSDLSLAYGVVPVGDIARDTLLVANAGTDTLKIISMIIDQPQFTADGFSFAVPPGDTVPVEVSFAPDDETGTPGTLSITTNDPDEGMVEVSLSGTGKFPVIISVTPDSIYEVTSLGRTSTRTLTIENIGQGPFEYIAVARKRIVEETASAGSLREDVSYDMNLPHAVIAAGDSSGPPGDPSTLDFYGLKIVFDRSHGQELMSSRSSFISTLTGMGAVVEENTSPITWDLLNNYDVFWSTEIATEFTSAEIGDLVAWVRAKGRILLIGDADPSLDIYDAILANLNAGMTLSSSNGVAGMTGNIYSHETTWGVDEIYLLQPNAIFRAIGSPAFKLVDDTGHNPVVAGSVVDGGRLVVATEEIFNDAAVDYGDNRRFGTQVFGWFVDRISWLTVSPDSGSVPVAQNAGIEARFDASALNLGEYDAEILVISASWDSVVAIVPAHLSVQPMPDIMISDSVLVFDTLYVGLRDSLAVTIYNVGNDTLLSDSIAVDVPCFSFDTTAFSLAPGTSIERFVAFHPTEIGSFAGTLRIWSNDPDESPVSIALEGTCIEAPRVVIAIDSLYERLLPREASMRPLVIANEGGDDLHFWISVFQLGPGQQASSRENARAQTGSTVVSRSRSFDGPDPFAPPAALKPEESAGSPRPVAVPEAVSPSGGDVVFYENFENLNYDGWSVGGGAGIREVTGATAADGSWYSYHEYSSSAGHFDGIYRTFGSMRPAYVSFWVRLGDNATNSGYFVLRSSAGEEVIWFFASLNGIFYLNFDVGGDQSYAYMPHVWYHIEFVNVDFESKTFDYQVNDSLVSAGVSFRNAATVNDIYRLDLYNYSVGGEAWWDEIFMGLTAPVDWLWVDRNEGTIAPDSAATIALTIDALGLDHGSYDTFVHIISNSTVDRVVSIPVHLDVDSTLQRTLALPLQAGWNLVSWNVDTAVDSVASLLAPVMDHLLVAHAFDEGGLTWSPALPPGFNTLQTLAPSRGVWLKLSAPDTLTIGGAAVHSQVPDILSSGYNLVSYLPYQEDSVGHAFASVLPSLEYAIGYDGPASLVYDPLASPGTNTLVRVKPGAGYWLKLAGPDTLLYPGLPVYPSDPPFMTAALGSGGGVGAAGGMSGGTAGVIPTTEWVNVWGDSVSFINGPVQAGTVVRAIDCDSVVCGEFVMTQTGRFGVMPVYRDDPFTAEDEGAEPGDTVMIYFDSERSYRSFVWSENGEIIPYEDLLTAVPEQQAVQPELALYQNYPNPFNPQTTIRFELPEAMPAHLAVYTVEGKLVRVLVDAPRPAGAGRSIWDGRDATGNPAASGIYFCRLHAGGRVLTKKMILLK